MKPVFFPLLSAFVAISTGVSAESLDAAARNVPEQCQQLQPGDPALGVYDMCLRAPLFAHHLYTLKHDGKEVLSKIDDESVVITETINGQHITGGCVPKNVVDPAAGSMSVEVSRTCTIAIDGKTVGQTTFTF